MNISVFEYDTRVIYGNSCPNTIPSMIASAINTTYANTNAAISTSPFTVVNNQLNNFASSRIRLALIRAYRSQLENCRTTTGGNLPSIYWGSVEANETCSRLPAASNLNFTPANFPRT